MKNSSGSHEAARLGVAHVPKGRGIFATLTVHENLVMAGRAGPATGPTTA